MLSSVSSGMIDCGEGAHSALGTASPTWTIIMLIRRQIYHQTQVIGEDKVGMEGANQSVLNFSKAQDLIELPDNFKGAINLSIV